MADTRDWKKGRDSGADITRYGSQLWHLLNLGSLSSHL